MAARAYLKDAGEIVTLSRETIARPDLAGATLIINATPLGMSHAPPMPEALLSALPPGATVFDMVYQPLDTPLVLAARARGLRTVDGLSMLIGQAREAFRLFFGAVPPRDCDAELRTRLAA